MLIKEEKNLVFHFAQFKDQDLNWIFCKIYLSIFDVYNALLKYFQMLTKDAKSFVELLKELRACNSLHVNKAQAMLFSV